MNNALLVAWRAPCVRTRAAQQFPPSSLLRQFYCETRSEQYPCRGQSNVRDTFQRRLKPSAAYRPSHGFQKQPTYISSCSFGTSPTHSKRTNRGGYFKAPKANGLRTFSASEITEIFGTSSVSTKLGNTALRVLQQRRVDGMLDLELPVDITTHMPESVLNNGLAWLRKNYSMDEDAAIMKRIEKEEQEDEDKMTRQAEKLGLFKPQSGRFGKQKEKEGDVYGRGVFDQMREKNKKLAEEEMERERREWLEGEEKDKANATKQLQQSTNLQKFQDKAPVKGNDCLSVCSRSLVFFFMHVLITLIFSRTPCGPQNPPFPGVGATASCAGDVYRLRSSRQTDHGTSSTLYPLGCIKRQFSTHTTCFLQAGRLLPSVGVALLVVGLCCLYADQYDPPPHDQRRWPDTPRSAATAIGLIGLNIAVFVLWRFPPAWRMLNRYFTITPVYPYALGLVGNMFSHQELRHIATNMLFVWFIGTKRECEAS